MLCKFCGTTVGSSAADHMARCYRRPLTPEKNGDEDHSKILLTAEILSRIAESHTEMASADLVFYLRAAVDLPELVNHLRQLDAYLERQGQYMPDEVDKIAMRMARFGASHG